MPRIPEDKLDEVRRAADLVDVVGRRVRLVKAGRSFKGRCPFHGDTDPSFIVNPERGTWHCFGCGEGGNIFSFVMRSEGLSFPEAVRELADRYGVDLPSEEMSPEEARRQEKKARLLRVLELAGTFFSQQLASQAGAEARTYIHDKRGLSPEVAAAFGLGYAPDQWEALGGWLARQGVTQNLAVEAGLLADRDRGSGAYDRFRGRVMLPIRDTRGRVISFGGRLLGSDKGAKYINGPETPVFNKSGVLYNLDRARRFMRQKDRALVVEGYFDVITLASQGFPETVAPLGTALTSQQARLLKGQAADVVLVFDGDEAGKRAAARALPLFLAEGVSPRALLLPAGEDPDSFLLKEGPAALEDAVGLARPLAEVMLDQAVAEGDLSSGEGKSAVVAEAGNIIKALNDPVASWEYLKRLAGALDLPAEVVAKRLGLPLGPSAGQPRRAPRPARRREAAPQWQEGVLELALASAAAAKVLCDEGLLDCLDDERLGRVAGAVAALVDRGSEPTPDAVMNQLEDADLHGLVCRLAEHGPNLGDDPDGHARQMAEQFKLRHRDRHEARRERLKRMKQALAAEVDTAPDAGGA